MHLYQLGGNLSGKLFLVTTSLQVMRVNLIVEGVDVKMDSQTISDGLQRTFVISEHMKSDVSDVRTVVTSNIVENQFDVSFSDESQDRDCEVFFPEDGSQNRYAMNSWPLSAAELMRQPMHEAWAACGRTGPPKQSSYQPRHIPNSWPTTLNLGGKPLCEKRKELKVGELPVIEKKLIPVDKPEVEKELVSLFKVMSSTGMLTLLILLFILVVLFMQYTATEEMCRKLEKISEMLKAKKLAE